MARPAETEQEIRKEARRRQAVRAQSILDDRVFQEASDKYRADIVAQMERIQLDGTEESERFALQLVHKLQARADFVRTLGHIVEASKFDRRKGES